ncbi:MAG: type IV toxin-antitoxin system AbiEi family antitoxin domain-containing protein [Syntrophales bacterium]
MKRNLGILETQFFAYVQMRKLRTVRAGDLVASVLKLAPEQERKLLSRLSRGGLIARVRQGLYLVPPSLPLGGAWAPSEALALNTLMEDVKGQYQICGPPAFNRYGFDEQIPNRTYAYNNRLFGDYTIGTVAMTLIKVADARLGETTDVVYYDGERATYASRVRTLVDAVYDWSRFNSLPKAYEWVRNDLRQKRVAVEELVTVTLRFGNTGTIRRLGALLEREGVDDVVLKRLEQVLNQTRSMIPWIPNRPKRGKFNRRWGVVLNEPS